MSNTESPKIELGKKVTLKKSENEQKSTILTTVPKGIQITIIKSNTDTNIFTSRTQVNIKVQNRRNTYQRVNKQLGES